jgi:hypothetical protein
MRTILKDGTVEEHDEHEELRSHVWTIPTPALGMCQQMMQRPPKRTLNRGAPYENRRSGKNGKAWSRPCPNGAVVEVKGKRYCSAHAPRLTETTSSE